jgi:hypothetical protein
LGVSAIGKNVFGDDPLIVFRRRGSQYEPEFAYLDRYLRLYDKHAGPPQFLSIQVWSYGMYFRGYGRDGGRSEQRADVVPIVEIQGDQLLSAEAPMYGKAGSQEMWRAVFDGVRQRIDGLGWNRTRLLLGTSGDTWPSRQTVEFFQQIAPDAQWRVLTHGTGCPKWGVTAHQRTQPNGMVVGYLEIARRLTNFREKRPAHPVPCNARDQVGSNPFTYRGLAVANTITTDYDGICWKGIDYWTYTAEDDTRRNALNHYVKFGNMVGGTPRAMCYPGPDGAVTTVQYEMLREGVQECEAALFVRDWLSPPVVATYDLGAISLSGALVREADLKNLDSPLTDAQDLDLELWFDETGKLVRVVPSARTYNTATKDHRATHQFAGTPAGGRLDLDVSIANDNWVRGGQGKFEVRLQRRADSYSGTYSGVYRGVARNGRVLGDFVPGGAVERSGSPPTQGDLARRAHQAVEQLSARYGSGHQAGGDLPDVVSELYRAATQMMPLAAKFDP